MLNCFFLVSFIYPNLGLLYRTVCYEIIVLYLLYLNYIYVFLMFMYSAFEEALIVERVLYKFDITTDYINITDN